MKRRIWIGAGALLGVIVLAMGWLLLTTKSQAHALITQPMGKHTVPVVSPAAYGLPYEDVLITSSDGVELVGWFVPSQNGAVVMAQHGYKANRQELLNDAALLAEHGYGVLLTTVRAHDYSGGERITFGKEEMLDLDAWYQYLLTRDDVDPARIGALGNSYGGTLVIKYAAQQPGIRAVATQSAFSSMQDTIDTSVRHFANVPGFPFVPLIVFWIEREEGFTAAEVDTTRWVAQLSPRPILLMQGGADTTISPESGQRLYDAAGEPKELWFEPKLDHVQLDGARAREYESRVISFFDRYLGAEAGVEP